VPCFSLFLGKKDIEFSVPKTKGTIKTFTSDRWKSKHLVLGCISANRMSDLHLSEGTIDMEAYIGIVQKH